MSPSAKTAVVCDTTAYLPAAIAEQHDIRLVSLYVSVGGVQQAVTPEQLQEANALTGLASSVMRVAGQRSEPCS